MVARKRDGIDEMAASDTTGLTYYWDSSGALGKQLNSFFMPRLYLLDGGKLRYLQPPEASPDEAAAGAAQEIQKGGALMKTN